MRAAVNRVDGVGESEDVLAIAVVVLQRDLDLHVAAFSFHVDRRVVQRSLAAIQMLDEFADAASEAKLRRFFNALVGEGDLQTLVKKGQFAQSLRQRIEAVGGLFKDCWIGMKGDLGSRFPRLAGLL